MQNIQYDKVANEVQQKTITLKLRIIFIVNKKNQMLFKSREVKQYSHQ